MSTVIESNKISMFPPPTQSLRFIGRWYRPAKAARVNRLVLVVKYSFQFKGEFLVRYNVLA